jgi:hypothetical protein
VALRCGLVGHTVDWQWASPVLVAVYWWVSLMVLCCSLVGQSSDTLWTGSGQVQC